MKTPMFIAGAALIALLWELHLPNAAAAQPAADAGAVATEGLSSTKDHGLVKVVAEPTLADGRLVLKIVAFNRDTAPAAFGPDSIRISTSAGQQVPLISLEQLVKEIRAAGGAQPSRAVDVYGSSGPLVGHDEAGRPDVGNYTGGSNSMGSRISTRERRPEAANNDDPKVQQQVANLRAAILQPLTIAPGSAAGGQIVTQKLKFGRKEEHTLRVLVDFNGEQHEFNLAAPPAH